MNTVTDKIKEVYETWCNNPHLSNWDYTPLKFMEYLVEQLREEQKPEARFTLAELRESWEEGRISFSHEIGGEEFDTEPAFKTFDEFYKATWKNSKREEQPEAKTEYKYPFDGAIPVSDEIMDRLKKSRIKPKREEQPEAKYQCEHYISLSNRPFYCEFCKKQIEESKPEELNQNKKP